MDTTKVVLFFLKEHDFADELDNEYLGKMAQVKKMMFREFED